MIWIDIGLGRIHVPDRPAQGRDRYHLDPEAEVQGGETECLDVESRHRQYAVGGEGGALVIQVFLAIVIRAAAGAEVVIDEVEVKFTLDCLINTECWTTFVPVWVNNIYPTQYQLQCYLSCECRMQ